MVPGTSTTTLPLGVERRPPRERPRWPRRARALLRGPAILPDTRSRARSLVLLVFAATFATGGCASFSNPVADAIPVNRLPAEVLGRSKSELRQVPLTLLRQQAPDSYVLDSGDVLAVIANEVIAPGDQQPPVRLAEQGGKTPAVGYPVPVRPDGQISIPLLPLIPVRGKTVEQVEQILRDAITGRVGGRELVKPEAARVSVQLLQPRHYQVLVVREDTGSGTGNTSSGVGAGGVGLGTTGNPFSGPQQGAGSGGKKGQGFTLNLPAYENDVLRALNATGGLPGLDAKNEVVISRGGKTYCDPAAQTIRIPLRIYPDQQITIREEDVILHEGDVVTIEARDRDIFYTAGLMGSGAYPLPRDVDLDVVQAIALVRGPLINGSFSQTAFVATSVNTGVGNPNASLCTVLRQLPDHRQVPIRVDLNKAFRSPRERILIQPGDIIVLQERPGEALARYFTQQFRFNTNVNLLSTPDVSSILNASNP